MATLRGAYHQENLHTGFRWDSDLCVMFARL